MPPPPADIPTIQSLEIVFDNFIKVFIYLSGIILFVLITIGGIKYLTSGADPKATESAQKTITYAVYGLVLLLFSYLILYLFLPIFGVNVTQFKITQ